MADRLVNPHLAAWDASLAASAAYARSTAAELPAVVLARRPSWGGWSVAEVLEHLCITDGLYEAPLRALFAAERTRLAPRESLVWKPTLFGRLLAWSLKPTNARKSQSPPAFRPGASPRNDVIAAWLVQVDAMRALMREADGLDLRRLTLSSPAAKFIRLNAGDAFALSAVHAERHMGQVRRTLADVVSEPAAT